MVVIKLPIERLLTKMAEPDALGRHGADGKPRAPGLHLVGPVVDQADPHRRAGRTSGATPSRISSSTSLGMAYRQVAAPETAQKGRGVRRREACAYIERHLEDPELSVAGIAAALGVSVRYLQRLFLETGATPRQHVLDRRLDTAAHRLRRSADTGAASITDIAFGVGFNDLSYFTRAFARKHGMSPRAYGRASGGSLG